MALAFLLWGAIALQRDQTIVASVCFALAKKAHLMPTGFGSAMLFTLLVVLPVTTLVSALTYSILEGPFQIVGKSAPRLHGFGHVTGFGQYS